MIRNLLLCMLFIPYTAFGVEHSIHVEWGYTPPSSPAVLGYFLYLEGVKKCTFYGAETFNGDCSIDFTKSQNSFTLTASFEDGTESPHSAPFVFTFVPSPIINSINIAEEKQ